MPEDPWQSDITNFVFPDVKPEEITSADTETIREAKRRLSRFEHTAGVSRGHKVYTEFDRDESLALAAALARLEAQRDEARREREELESEVCQWRTSIATEALEARAVAAEASVDELRRLIQAAYDAGTTPHTRGMPWQRASRDVLDPLESALIRVGLPAEEASEPPVADENANSRLSGGGLASTPKPPGKARVGGCAGGSLTSPVGLPAEEVNEPCDCGCPASDYDGHVCEDFAQEVSGADLIHAESGSFNRTLHGSLTSPGRGEK